MKKQDIKEMEKQDAAGYARISSDASEFKEWESEQVWPGDEGEPENAIQQTASAGGTSGMDEALERAAEIRRQLEDRSHSDSTRIVSEDRQR